MTLQCADFEQLRGSRKFPDAVIRDPEQAVQQVFAILEENALITRSGKRLPTEVHTFCTHGDEPTGPAVASAVRAALETSRIRVVPLPELSY